MGRYVWPPDVTGVVLAKKAHVTSGADVVALVDSKLMSDPPALIVQKKRDTPLVDSLPSNVQSNGVVPGVNEQAPVPREDPVIEKRARSVGAVTVSSAVLVTPA